MLFPAFDVRFKRWKIALVLGIASGVAALVIIVLLVPYTSGRWKGRVVSALADRLHADVTLGDFRARLFPSLRVEGANLVIRRIGHSDEAPLISVESFSADGGILPLLHKHVTNITLVGLEIKIPPGRDDDRAAAGTSVATSGQRESTDIVIDHLVSSDARLVIVPDEPGKAPKVWAIHHLRMANVGANTAMPFTATLTNAVPPGEIETSGTFGPWQPAEPAETPLDGRFEFAHADLSVFKGISGILSARGTFGGSLGRIDINGETDTPQFAISVANHPIPLHATYHSIVDGTNGDTILERIDARLVDTALVAKGAVVQDAGNDAGDKGRTVSLEVAIDRGRLEDLLRLAVPTSKPPMVGAVHLTTRFVLPPGDVDVVDKLRLDGRFTIEGAEFLNYDVQKKIDELSKRSQGKDPDTPGARVRSDFAGRFTLKDARLRLPDLTFTVRGAQVRLAGNYGLKSEALDFRGDLLMDASISDTQRGLKRILLKIVDPLFKKEGGGSSIPIRISGTRNDPSFGLDKSRIFHK